MFKCVVVKSKKGLKINVQNRAPSWCSKMHIFTLIIQINTWDDEMENVGLINLIFQSKCFHFVFAAHNEGLGRICFRRKNYAMHSSNLKSKMWDCWKTNFIPIISVFTLVNSELRNISNDQMTLKYLILNYLRCHLSFVIFAFILSCQYLVWFLCRIFSSRVFVPSVGCAYENVCSPRCNLTHKVTRLMMT